ncbi:MAG: peptide chain release factor N(5)-glutamine methyltransferase [Solirubrobacterales bacterium]
MRALSAGRASVGDALEGAIGAIRAAGAGTPRLDAELLLSAASGIARTTLAAEPTTPLPPGSGRTFAEMIRRRVAREPVAYILRRKGFRHLDLLVDGRALIPRPETELLVEIALEHANLKGTVPFRFLDVGTGSGAVALAIADELPGASVVATDTSPVALELAKENAILCGVADRVRFEPGSLPASGRFDLLVANLPYVSEAEWEGLEPEITRYEPKSALVPGPTGLEAIEALLGELSVAEPRRVGAIALEVGAGQAASVSELCRRAGYERVETRGDLAGIERVVLADHT